MHRPSPSLRGGGLLRAVPKEHRRCGGSESRKAVGLASGVDTRGCCLLDSEITRGLKRTGLCPWELTVVRSSQVPLWFDAALLYLLNPHQRSISAPILLSGYRVFPLCVWLMRLELTEAADLAPWAGMSQNAEEKLGMQGALDVYPCGCERQK